MNDFYKNKEIESEKCDLNDTEILNIKSIDLPKDILASLHSNLDYEMLKSNNLFFMQQLLEESVKAIEMNGIVSYFLKNDVVANETEAYVLKK
ncbi:hypothetical protein HHO41_13330 [Bacillus sp. DNRA2]|uniref:hypothetical protein n=1 Tax=Bacillus sp. DNRA2 TaxID=2723053 RepID=UPI00145C48D7|nr:hypothetical protein [Bacillus sp. DNRA2]NMD71280.1 hypothetical protein [Bacillus sp. DNRA2]